MPWKYTGASLVTLDYDEHNKDAIDALRRYVERLPWAASNGVNVVLVGPKGTGRTYALWALLAHIVQAPPIAWKVPASRCWVADRGYGQASINRAMFRVWPELHNTLASEAKRGGSRETMTLCKRAEFLALDDVAFSGPMERWETEHLFEIVNDRYNSGRPTFITTNQAVSREETCAIDARIVDRLLEANRGILKKLGGPSRRPKRYDL